MRFLQATLAFPHSSPVSSGTRGPSLRRPRFPHRARQPGLGARGLVLRPGALFPTRNKRASSGPGRGVAAGSGPTPAHPRGPADAETRPTSSPSRAPPLALPSGLRVGVLAPLSSAPAPTHQWPAEASRTARVPPAPSLHQPSGKLSNSHWSPQLRSPWLQPERGLAPGGHLPYPDAVRARAPAVSGCFPKVHSGEAGRVA